MRALALLTACLCLTACGAAKAISDYAAAESAWNDQENAKAQKVRAAYDTGMKMHGEYMAMKPPADAGIKVAQAWYAQQSMLMGKINEAFNPVHHSTFYDKILFVEARLGEGWEKIVVELQAMHGADLAAHPEKDTLIAEFNQALLNATTYYDRVAHEYTTDYPEVAARNADAVANAKARAAALKALRKE